MNRAVTSASNLLRRKICPGSARMEAQFDQGEESDYSREGTHLHSLFMRFPKFEGDDLWVKRESLNEDQKFALLSAEEMTLAFLASIRELYHIPEDAEHVILHEQTLTFRKGSVRFPGHADIIVNWPRHRVRVIVDAKFGFMEVEDAADNYQLVSYAVQSQQRDPYGVCGVQIVQPRNFGPKQSSAIYTAEFLEPAADELENIILDSEKPEAPLVASEKGCHFCSAKANCPAYKEKFMQLETTLPRAIETVDNDELARLKDAIAFAAKISDDVNDELRRRIEEGRMPGWKLKNTGSTREVTDPIQLFEDLSIGLKDHGFTAWEYEQTRETKWGALEALVQKLTGWTQKQAKEYVKQVSAPYVTETPKAKAPVREKK